jgi:deoxyribonuclease IV
MFGAHLSISGGLHQALLKAELLQYDCVQVFTKNQKMWRCKPLEEAEVGEWKGHCQRLGFERTVSHDSYLINLASPDEGLWLKSVELFVEELRRCVSLGIPYLVTHPGAHMGAGEEAGLLRVAAALNVVHDQLSAGGVLTCLEVTAGQGTGLGYKLEHLAEVIERVKAPQRVAVCLDTAHLFAAGYDWRGRKYAKFVKELERTVGLDRVKVWHLNDSKKELGSRVDRHEHIGRGTIGVEGFRPIVRDKRWRTVPKVIETEKGTDEKGRDWDAVNVEVLRGLM